MAMIKVLHYAPGFNYGGIESRMVDWYTNMNRDDVKFILIKLNNMESAKTQELKRLGAICYDLPPFTFKNLIQHISEVHRILVIERPNIVHVHNTETSLFVLALSAMYGIKTRIIHARTTGFPDGKKQVLRKILHKLTPLFGTDFWACSREAALWGFGKVKGNSAKVIKNGIQLENFYFDLQQRIRLRNMLNLKDEFVVGTVGRFTYQKNYPFLLRVFKRIHDIEPKSKLVIVGEGKQRLDIEMECQRLGIKPSVIFVGESNEVWKYYMAFDLFLGTSYYEGFGTTAIEAQATGLNCLLSTGFPKTVEVTPNVKRVPLQVDETHWAKQAFDLYRKNSIRSKDAAILVQEAGYNAKDVAKEIEEFYFSRIF